MSFFSFNIAGNALDTYQEALNVTSNNIANVATPGASRQSANISEQIPISGSPFYSPKGTPGTLGEGAVVSQITRIHQDSYDGLFRGASSSQYFYTTEQQQLSNLQSNFGEPNNGVNSAFAAFQNTISQLSATGSPQTVPARQGVLNAAQTFATAVNAANSALTTQKALVISQGASVVAQANTLIDHIASLNGQIRSLAAAGDNPNTYLDQRDLAIDQLSQIVQTTTTQQANGSTLVSVDGRPLVNDTVAYDLAGPVVGSAPDGTPTLVVGFANDPNPSNPVPIPLGSGQLAAYTDLYNNKLTTYGTSLDQFASAAANEVNRITQAGVDLNSNNGTALFNNGAGGTSGITAADLSVAITDPTELPVGLISTAAGTLTQGMNSANNTVSTSVAITGNATLLNPPAATLTGNLTVAVDGTSQTFAYSTAPAGNSATIGGFMTSFNAAKLGVTASFDPATQTIVFARDPNNTDARHRALQGANATTPGFTITDSSAPTLPAPQGIPATSLLQALGATNISGVAQTAANAYGAADNGAANALTAMFSNNVGVGALQTTAGAVSAPGAGSITITPPSATAYATVQVGQSLRIVNAGTATTQDVLVTAVNRITGSITVGATATINAGDAITTTPQQTLSGSYQSLVTQMALDASTATTGVGTQTALASSIDQARQSVDGINIDEETQNLLKFQNAYSAAAKTLSTLNAVMQQALGLITGG